MGDYNLPKAVGWTLAGRIADDAGMLELRPLRGAALPRDQAHRARRQPSPAPRPAYARARLPRVLARIGHGRPARTGPGASRRHARLVIVVIERRLPSTPPDGQLSALGPDASELDKIASRSASGT